MISKGIKHDKQKDRWDLLPWDVIQDVVKVLTYGARKYAPDNWQKVESGEDRFFAAGMRHLIAWRNGVRLDPETKLNNLSCAICNLIFLAWKDKRRKA